MQMNLQQLPQTVVDFFFQWVVAFFCWPALAWLPLLDNSLTAINPCERPAAKTLCIFTIMHGGMCIGGAFTVAFMMLSRVVVGQDITILQYNTALFLLAPYALGFALTQRLRFQIDEAVADHSTAK